MGGMLQVNFGHCQGIQAHTALHSALDQNLCGLQPDILWHSAVNILPVGSLKMVFTQLLDELHPATSSEPLWLSCLLGTLFLALATHLRILHHMRTHAYMWFGIHSFQASMSKEIQQSKIIAHTERQKTLQWLSTFTRSRPV